MALFHETNHTLNALRICESEYTPVRVCIYWHLIDANLVLTNQKQLQSRLHCGFWVILTINLLDVILCLRSLHLEPVFYVMILLQYICLLIFIHELNPICLQPIQWLLRIDEWRAQEHLLNVLVLMLIWISWAVERSYFFVQFKSQSIRKLKLLTYLRHST